MAKIFISYTAKDRIWAQWIGVTLRDNGHVPFVHEWEIGAGENIPRWMDEKIKAADRLLGVFTNAYTQAIYSGAERLAAFWQDPEGRKGFLVPVEVETVADWPSLTAPLKRLSLVGLNETEAETELVAFLLPPTPPDKRPPFPGRHELFNKRIDLDAILEQGEQANAFKENSEPLPQSRPALPETDRPQLSDEEHQLWATATRSVQPLQSEPHAPPPDASRRPASDDEALPDPSDRDAFQRWLATKPREWSVVIAARAALRVPPFVRANDFGADETADIVLPVFRATAIARFAAVYPNRADHNAANDAGASAVRAAAATYYDPRRGAGRAAYTAGYAALNATKAAAEAAADVADIVIAVEAGLSEAGVVQAGDELVSADVARHTVTGLAIRRDLSALISGLPPDRLARMPLWQPNEMSVAVRQGRASASWMRLQSALPRISKHWRVWVTWYNHVLAGSPPSPPRSEAWEAAFTDVQHPSYPWQGPLPWGDGPEAVNLAIKARLDALASPNNESQASLTGTSNLVIDEDRVRIVRGEPPQRRRDGPSRLVPLEGVHSPLSFGWSSAQTIVVVSGSANWPVLPLPTSERDHAQRLEACHTLARDLIKELASCRYQARDEYKNALQTYDDRLPITVGEGNILLADAEARILRQLFAAEAAILSAPFAARLKTLIEQHIGLRVFYPEIGRFYSDVRSGTIETPLPLDAVDGFIEGIRANTPEIFDPSVTIAVDEAAALPPPIAQPEHASPVEPATPTPPADPLGELDPKKSRDYSIAGTINELWKAFRQGETIVKNSKAWYEAYSFLSDKVGPVLDWLQQFLGGGGDGSPPMPPTIPA